MFNYDPCSPEARIGLIAPRFEEGFPLWLVYDRHTRRVIFQHETKEECLSLVWEELERIQDEEGSEAALRQYPLQEPKTLACAPLAGLRCPVELHRAEAEKIAAEKRERFGILAPKGNFRNWTVYDRQHRKVIGRFPSESQAQIAVRSLKNGTYRKPDMAPEPKAVAAISDWDQL